MKKQVKRILALLMALVMCLGIFAGCDTNNPPETSTPTESTKSTEDTTPSGSDETTPPAELKNADIFPLDCDKTFNVGIVHANSDVNSLDCAELWEEVTGVDVNYITMTGEQIQMAFNTDTLPDAILCGGGVERDKADEYGDAGKLVNFKDYLHLMPNFSRALEEYPEVRSYVESASGAIYSLPRIAPYTHDAVIVRTDMLKAAGWEELPGTIDELKQCIADVQAYYGANDPEFHAFNAYAGSWLEWDNDVSLPHFFFPSFGDLMKVSFAPDADGNVKLGAATEQYQRLLKFLKELVGSDAFAYGKDIYAEDGTRAEADTVDGKCAFMVIAWFMDKTHFPSGNIDLTVLSPLTSEWQDEKRFDPRYDVYWQLSCISSECEDIETMVKWMDSFYAQEDDPLDKEGTVWCISTDVGRYGVDFGADMEKKTYYPLPHEGYSSASTWKVNESFAVAARYEWTLSGEIVTGLDALVAETLENALPYKVKTFNLNSLHRTQEDTDRYFECFPNIDSHITQWTAAFITGEKDIDADWDEYIQGLENLGLQDIIDGYQRAYDSYMAG